MHRMLESAKPAFRRRTSNASIAFDTAQVLRRRSASSCSGARTLFNAWLLFCESSAEPTLLLDQRGRRIRLQVGAETTDLRTKIAVQEKPAGKSATVSCRSEQGEKRRPAPARNLQRRRSLVQRRKRIVAIRKNQRWRDDSRGDAHSTPHLSPRPPGRGCRAEGKRAAGTPIHAVLRR